MFYELQPLRIQAGWKVEFTAPEKILLEEADFSKERVISEDVEAVLIALIT